MGKYGRDSGSLRDRIQLRRMQMLDDGKGGQVPSLVQYAQPFARIEDLGGRESVIAHSLQGIRSFRITIRWRPDVSAEDQIILPDGTELAVTAPPSDPDFRREWLVIMANSGSVVKADG